MKLKIIVAMTRERVIGNQGRLPWYIPEDLKLFREITLGNTILMGRRTFESIPEKYRPLVQRNNIVLTSGSLVLPGVHFCKSLEEALNLSADFNLPTFVIGGASLYKQTLPLVDTMFISHIKKTYQGDTYFPELDLGEWKTQEEKDFKDFVFRVYKRISKEL
jgi:dihydrofolate reductase